MDIVGKIRKFFFPFIIIFAILIMVVGSILNIVKNFLIEHRTEMLLVLATAVFVVPIVFSLFTNWEIPGIIIFYDFIYGFVVLIMMFNLADNKHYEQEGGYNGCNGYQNPQTVNKVYGYNSTFFTPVNREKERNGGFTDIEVKEKKKLIRKKLEKKNLLESRVREEVTTNE